VRYQHQNNRRSRQFLTQNDSIAGRILAILFADVGFFAGELRLGEGEGQKPGGASDVPGAGADVSDQVAKLMVSVIRSLEPTFLESILPPGYLI